MLDFMSVGLLDSCSYANLLLMIKKWTLEFSYTTRCVLKFKMWIYCNDAQTGFFYFPKNSHPSECGVESRFCILQNLSPAVFGRIQIPANFVCRLLTHKQIPINQRTPCSIMWSKYYSEDWVIRFVGNISTYFAFQWEFIKQTEIDLGLLTIILCTQYLHNL